MHRQPVPTWIDYWDSQTHFRPMMRAVARHFCRAAQQYLRLGARDVVLDIGCGPGDLEALLAGRVRAIHGVDTSPSMVAECRRRFRDLPGLTFGRLDSDNYTDLSSLPGGPFTRIICLSVIQYYRNPSELRSLVNNVARIASPGATLLVADIPVASRPFSDSLSLVITCARHGCVGAFVRMLVGSAFSSYRTLRQRTGILTYSQSDLAALAGGSGRRVTVMNDRLTFSRGRVHIRVEFEGGKTP